MTNALVVEWKQVPAAMFQHLVESLPRRVEAVIAAMFLHLVESLPRRVEAVIAAKGVWVFSYLTVYLHMLSLLKINAVDSERTFRFLLSLSGVFYIINGL